MAHTRRLSQLLSSLAPSQASIGTLKLGDVTYDVSASKTPSRLVKSTDLLDLRDPFNLDNLHFILQKYLLGQDVFLVSQPGPYARRLALTFANIINSEYEYVALHRDVGETELKQGREIRAGGSLVYVDSPTVNAAKNGRLLILEGIEKAERGIMPLLNNLLENREMNLDDGSHIIHPHRYDLMDGSRTQFIPAHRNFRVIAIAAPVPPYPGYPLDPPFRSRFQARFIDPLGSMVALSHGTPDPLSPLFNKLKDLILALQYSTETRHALEPISKTTLPPFPQTALVKLKALLTLFPASPTLSPTQLTRLLISVHPALIYAPPQAWVTLNRHAEDLEIGHLSATLENDTGLLGYQLNSISRSSPSTAELTFLSSTGTQVKCTVPAGPKELLPFPLQVAGLHNTERFSGLLTSMLQAHALGYDISYIPPAQPFTASTSTSTLVATFAKLLGYDTDVVHMYKELGGRELLMRRHILDGGATTWEPSTLVQAAWDGRLVHLSGLDVIGATAGSLGRMMQDRETELWAGRRLVASASEDGTELSAASKAFRVIVTASKSLPLRDWLSDEHANMFFAVPAQPMDHVEERAVLNNAAHGVPANILESLLQFAEKYRVSIGQDNVQRHRKLGTRTLVRIAKRLAAYPDASELRVILRRVLLAEFLPPTERTGLEDMLELVGIPEGGAKFNPNPAVVDNTLTFPAPTVPGSTGAAVSIPLFNPKQDEEGVSLIPYMDHFYENSVQTGMMRDIVLDMEVLGEHLVLLGNQGVGKNKIVDRLCQLLQRPREYVQLHRDTTVNQLMFTTTLESGVLKYTDSPLLRAIRYGRVIVVDEADKAPEHVVAIFKSLAGSGEMSLSDGRRVCRTGSERPGDIVVHNNFRLVLLANRPGYPFLGNHFLQVLGENFSAHAVGNPDEASERKLLEQLAPDMDAHTIQKLVSTFQDLRIGYESGTLGYPYSLRELINLVKHLQAYPTDSLDNALRNVFDFDVYKPDTIDKLETILIKNGLQVSHLGLDAARESAKKIEDIQFVPKETDLAGPKEGKHDDEDHHGGNTWAGGTGGRDTAGLGGRGGYKRLWKGGEIKQVSEELKADVPEHIKERARLMAKEELAQRLKDLDMGPVEAQEYSNILRATESHMNSLFDLLENLAAKEEERVWIKRQTDGELDDSRLTEGLTGEATVYKRRGMEKPELGRPQIKPKRIRFIFDVSASMYRFQYDGRLKRSQETAVMLMETFDRLSRKDKYVWDMYGHSGDGPEIPLVQADAYPATVKDRWKVVEKMEVIPQYAFAGDYTVEAIRKGVQQVAKYDADDWFVIAITDANFGRYNIQPEDITRAMKKDPKVNTALVCIGEGAEAPWISKRLPGQGFTVRNTSDIPAVLRSILSTMVNR
ncbi:hypothetical protein CYLTODRAFT_488278 [Cylindrobasidium torrendii FP15055 ss-10]|uniref:ATPase dynein-related AAA domain-containing protein n=1 Tax=Cylindrobasidium torrendii FP15055 ss-10 TaxID=1314674 RepID=A0A0D7BJ56_9AGAR|nr:hypothetical protein CYLTODRAFT_488278 [Cylindrobasidium torrendii FP15055 ss-10]